MTMPEHTDEEKELRNNAKPVDWTVVRKIVLAAKPDWQSVNPSQPKPEDVENEAAYNFAQTVMEIYSGFLQVTCCGCRRRRSQFDFYRCWDCKAYLCEDCIKAHFGPRHRPHPKLIKQYEEELAAMRRLSPAPQTGQVTEAMVEAGARAMWARNHDDQFDPREDHFGDFEDYKDDAREVLTAALGTKGR